MIVLVETPVIRMRPVARLIRIIGEELIGDNTTGLMELIKNGFDADATQVIVTLNNLFSSEKTEIIIEDNGIGMKEEIICGPWSEPAHGEKEEYKKIEHRTAKGRLPLGEKGVGRFAAQSLGHSLEMVTKPEGEQNEYHVIINWDQFDTNDTYIDDIKIPLTKRSPIHFTESMHGTKLTIQRARTPWTQKDVERLQARLMRLLSPTESNQDFSVQLKVPELPEYENLHYDDILKRFQFKIDCTVEKNGNARYTYSHRTPDGKITQINGKLNLWMEVDDSEYREKPSCGAFRSIVYAWLRTASNLNEYEITRDQLNDLCGISIYRDGFRVIPYGDIDNDWLGLSTRRVNLPGEKYDNNQVIGRLEITYKENNSLIDKTSREGLQENKSFSDLKALSLQVMQLLESESSPQREKLKKPSRSKKELHDQVTELRKDVDDIVQATRSKAPNQSNKLIGSDQTSDPNPVAVLPSDEDTVPVKFGNIRKLDEQTKKFERITNDLVNIGGPVSSLGFDEKENEVMLHLAGIGLVAERFAHELDRMIGTLLSNLLKLEETHPQNKNVKVLRLIFDSLQNEIKLLNVAKYSRSESVPATDVNQIIKTVCDAHSDEFKEYKIKFSIEQDEEFNASISGASLSQVLDNIIANAIYWLKRKSEVDDRRLLIFIDSIKMTIEIYNSGPHIQQHIKRSLFKKAFISSKADGRGLGMFLSSEILRRFGASLQVVDDPDLLADRGNTGFRISFPLP